MKITKVEKCEKCGAFRAFSIYENGLREKEIYSIRGRKCKHKWRKAKDSEL